MTSLNRIFRICLPTWARKTIGQLLVLHRIFVDHMLDFARYYRYSRSRGSRNFHQLRAAIVAHYHVLEKGLVMPNRKSRFGEDIASNLLNLLRQWERTKFGDDPQITAAQSTLRAYSNNVDNCVLDHLPALSVYAHHRDNIESGESGGVRLVKRETFLAAGRGNFRELVYARRSVRNFTNEPVSIELIEEAVRIAQLSPSVCNRQCGRVFFTVERSKIDAILELQNGNRGFGHLATGLLIITSDLSVFEGGGERNQPWIDGGLFSMSLLYAFTFLGVGACPLNWCVDSPPDTKLRKMLDIPDHQAVIMMIAIGHYPEEFLIAASCRNNTAEVLCHLK